MNKYLRTQIDRFLPNLKKPKAEQELAIPCDSTGCVIARSEATKQSPLFA
jgi:hypothetical protein